MKNKSKKENKIKTENNHINLDEEIIIGMKTHTNGKSEKKAKYAKAKKKKLSSKKETNNKIKKQNTKIKKQNTKVKKQNNKIKKQTPTEKKQKKKQNKILKVFLRLIFLIIVISCLVSFLLISPIFNITNIYVENNEKLSDEKIVSLSKIKNNENIFRFSIKKAEESILENTYVESVQIKRIYPNEITIKIEERKIKFAIEYASSYMYISDQGYLLEVVSENQQFPILEGFETEVNQKMLGKRLVVNDLRKLDTAIKILETMKLNNLEGLITKINIADSDDIILSLDSEEKIVHLGDCSDLTTRILYLKELLTVEKGKKGEVFIKGSLTEEKVRFRETVL